MGLIASLILENVRNKREDELAARGNAAAQQMVARWFGGPTEADEDAELLREGSGIIGAPTRGERQAATLGFVADAFGNDQLRPAAVSLMSSIINERGADSRQAAKLELDRAQFDQSQAQQQRQFNTAQRTRDMVAQARARAANATAARAALGAGVNKDGSFLMKNPVSGDPSVAYLPGSKVHTEAVRTVREVVTDLNAVSELSALFRANGMQFNTTMAGRMALLRDKLRAAWARETNRGVLQEGEAEEMDRLLADPTRLSDVTARSRMIGSLAKMEEFLQQKHGVNASIYSAWPGMGRHFQALQMSQDVIAGEAGTAANPEGRRGLPTGARVFDAPAGPAAAGEEAAATAPPAQFGPGPRLSAAQRRAQVEAAAAVRAEREEQDEVERQQRRGQRRRRNRRRSAREARR